ncbi:MAG: 16S rRNA (uracil(1498)-N(3))-methyltransferase, partial [Clostridia bacterium]|nr:16S rRNA (uracil(1498)-N(3))-methyltransferase [Clostridia bacterium]
MEKIEEVTELCGEEFEHAKNVLRLGVGDEVILLDNSGKEYTAVIAQVEKKRMLLNVVREEVGEREPNVDVCL